MSGSRRHLRNNSTGMLPLPEEDEATPRHTAAAAASASASADDLVAATAAAAAAVNSPTFTSEARDEVIIEEQPDFVALRRGSFIGSTPPPPTPFKGSTSTSTAGAVPAAAAAAAAAPAAAATGKVRHHRGKRAGPALVVPGGPQNAHSLTNRNASDRTHITTTPGATAPRDLHARIMSAGSMQSYERKGTMKQRQIDSVMTMHARRRGLDNERFQVVQAEDVGEVEGLYTIGHLEEDDANHRKSIARTLISALVCTLLFYAMINVYAQIVFEHAGLESARPIGVSIFLLSLMTSVLITSLFSSSPISIAGPDINSAVFLGQASDVIASEMDSNREDILITVLFMIASGTLLVSITLYLIGRFKLTSALQFMPQPVLAGFLAGVGFLVFAESLTVATGHHLELSHLDDTFGGWKQWKILIPSFILGAALYYVKRCHVGNPVVVIPAFLVLPNVIFYIVLVAIGWSRDDARASGWMFPEADSVPFYESFSEFHFSSWGDIDFGAWFKTLPDLILMDVIFVLDFLLNLAGVERFLKLDVDFDFEMMLTGKLSFFNAFVGAPAGFAQTKFTLINHGIIHNTHERASGYVTCMYAAILFFAGFPLINHMPRFFLAGLVVFAALGLLVENLWDTRKVLSKKEFVVVWIILIVNFLFGVLFGILVGIVLAALIFAWQAASRSDIKTSVTCSTFHSRVDRPMLHYRKLEQLGGLMLGIQLKGFIFFGSATKVVNCVHQTLRVQEDLPQYRRVRYVVLDFDEVDGIDSSAAAIFATIARQGISYQYEVLWSSCSNSVLGKLLGEKLISLRDPSRGPSGGYTHVFETFDDAVEWVEEEILHYASMIRSKWLVLPSMKKLNAVAAFKALKGSPLHEVIIAHWAVLHDYCEHSTLPAGTVIGKVGDVLSKLYLLLHGKVTTYVPSGRKKHTTVVNRVRGTSARKKMRRRSLFGKAALDGAVDSSIVCDADGNDAKHHSDSDNDADGKPSRRGSSKLRTGAELLEESRRMSVSVSRSVRARAASRRRLSGRQSIGGGIHHSHIQRDPGWGERVSSRFEGALNHLLDIPAPETIVVEELSEFVTFSKNRWEKLEAKEPRLFLQLEKAIAHDIAYARNRLERAMHVDTRGEGNGYTHLMRVRELEVCKKSALVSRLAEVVQLEVAQMTDETVALLSNTGRRDLKSKTPRRRSFSLNPSPMVAGVNLSSVASPVAMRRASMSTSMAAAAAAASANRVAEEAGGASGMTMREAALAASALHSRGRARSSSAVIDSRKHQRRSSFSFWKRNKGKQNDTSTALLHGVDAAEKGVSVPKGMSLKNQLVLRRSEPVSDITERGTGAFSPPVAAAAMELDEASREQQLLARVQKSQTRRMSMPAVSLSRNMATGPGGSAAHHTQPSRSRRGSRLGSGPGGIFPPRSRRGSLAVPSRGSSLALIGEQPSSGVNVTTVVENTSAGHRAGPSEAPRTSVSSANDSRKSSRRSSIHADDDPDLHEVAELTHQFVRALGERVVNADGEPGKFGASGADGAMSAHRKPERGSLSLRPSGGRTSIAGSEHRPAVARRRSSVVEHTPTAREVRRWSRQYARGGIFVLSKVQSEQYTEAFKTGSAIVDGRTLMKVSHVRHVTLNMGYYLTHEQFEELRIKERIPPVGFIDLSTFLRFMTQVTMVDLPPTTMAQYRAVFAMFDKDNNGTLDQDELQLMFRHMAREVLTEAEIFELMDEWAVSQGNVLTFSEFASMMAYSIKRDMLDSEVEDAYQLFSHQLSPHASDDDSEDGHAIELERVEKERKRRLFSARVGRLWRHMSRVVRKRAQQWRRARRQRRLAVRLKKRAAAAAAGGGGGDGDDSKLEENNSRMSRRNSVASVSIMSMSMSQNPFDYETQIMEPGDGAAQEDNPEITVSNVRRIIRHMTGVRPTAEEVEEMVWVADSASSGTINWVEFVEMITTIYEPGWIVLWDWCSRSPLRFAHDVIHDDDLDEIKEGDRALSRRFDGGDAAAAVASANLVREVQSVGHLKEVPAAAVRRPASMPRSTGSSKVIAHVSTSNGERIANTRGAKINVEASGKGTEGAGATSIKGVHLANGEELRPQAANGTAKNARADDVHSVVTDEADDTATQVTFVV